MKVWKWKLLVFYAVVLMSASSSFGLLVQDDATTVGLYRFESTYVDSDNYLWSPDENQLKNCDMLLQNGATITSGNQGLYGEALYLDGVAARGLVTANNNFIYPDIKVEMAFKMNSATWSGSKYLANLNGAMRLYLNTNQMVLTVWDSLLASKTIKANINLDTNWQTVTASYQGGVLTLQTSAQTVTATFGSGTLRNVGVIPMTIGMQASGTYFNGWIDELKISSTALPEPASICVLAFGGLLFRMKRKLH